METIQDAWDMEEVDSWGVMNEMRSSEVLCDAILISSEGTQFPAHQVVLAGCSPYFRTVLLRPNHPPNHHVIELPVDSESTSAMLEFIYTKNISLRLENVLKVFEAASQVDMQDMMTACIQFVRCNITDSTCVNFLQYAINHRLPELRHICKRFLLKNFSRLARDGSVLAEIPSDDFQDIISEDSLNVRSEEELFDAAMEWATHNHERSDRVVDVLRHVRLGLVEADFFLQKIATHPCILKSENNMRGLLMRSWEYIFRQEQSGSKILEMSSSLVRPRVPRCAIFILGGWSGGAPIPNIEVYDPRADRWYSQPHVEQPTSPRAYHGVVTLFNKMYLLGGFDGRKYFNTLTCFDAELETWSEAAPMYNKRCYVSVAELQGHIYALGGFDGRSRLKSAERYDPQTNQWTMLPAMTHKRSDASASSLPGKVYIAGGFNGDQCMRSVEAFDPHANQWTELTPISLPRSGLCLKSCSNYMYAIGGFDGERRLRSVERYCEESQKWEPVADMHLPRSNFAAVAMEERLFVLGGFNGSRTIHNAEYFDSELNEWQDIANINVNRSAFQACVLADLSNVKSYTFHGQTED